jgi:hypothetical protein
MEQVAATSAVLPMAARLGRRRYTIRFMLRRALRGVLSAASLALILAWFAGSIALAIWVFRVTGIPAGRKAGFGLWMMIYLVPIGLFVAFDEFLLRRIRYGPPTLGRRKLED